MKNINVSIISNYGYIRIYSNVFLPLREFMHNWQRKSATEVTPDIWNDNEIILAEARRNYTIKA